MMGLGKMDPQKGSRTNQLEQLFQVHLATRQQLADMRMAENEILSRIIELLSDVPARLQEGVVRRCVAKAAENLSAQTTGRGCRTDP